MGKGSLCGSPGRVSILQRCCGHWVLTGGCRARGRLPQLAPPADTFPAAMAATSQPVPKIACRRAGFSPAGGACRLYGWDLVGGGTGIDFPAALCSDPRAQCLKEGAGTGAKTAALVPKWLLGVHRAVAVPASGSGWAPAGGFLFPCEAQIYGSRSQKQGTLSH